MKNLLAILLLFATVLPVAGQSDKNSPTESYLFENHKEKKTNNAFNNQFEFDVEFFALSGGYNHRLYKNWFLGVNAGIGIGINVITLSGDGGLIGGELFHIGIVSEYFIYSNLKVVVNPKISEFLNGSFDGSDTYSTTGLGAEIYYGKKIQIGLKTTIGAFNNGNGRQLLLSSSLLVIKFPIRW